jgi:hypothetical protein
MGALVRSLGVPRSAPPCPCYPALSARPGLQQQLQPASEEGKRHNGVAYRGVNVIALWMQAMAEGYAAPVWMTFRQAINLGGCVRKGEKGSLTVYADSITRTETDEQTGEENPQKIHYMKGYTVFNVEQIDGLPAHYYARPAPRTSTIQRIERAESFFAATRGGALRIRRGREDRPLVAFEKFQPVIEIARVFRARLGGQFEVGAQESRAKLGDQFLHRVAFIAPPAFSNSRTMRSLMF